MGKAYDRVLQAVGEKGLKHKTTGPHSFTFQAPGHSTADLSVNVTDTSGQVLVYSHSDPTEDVLADLGLKPADLFDEPKGVEYKYAGGRVVHRSPTKRFMQSGNKQDLTLYRSERLASASVVFFTEGEKDVHALETLGVVATTNAGGAGKAHNFDLTPLYGKHLQIVRDMDAAGDKHATKLVEALTGKAASITILEPKTGKDAADHVAAGFGVDDFTVGGRPAVVAAPQSATPEPYPADDPRFEAAVTDAVFFDRVRAEARSRQSATGAATLDPKLLRDILAMDVKHDWLVEGLLETRDRLVLTGGEGAGKSYLTRQLAICIAAGVHPFLNRHIEPRRVLVIDAENSERQWSRNTKYVTELVGSRGKADPGTNVLVSAGTRLNLKLKADIDTVHRLMDQHNPSVVYIGPLYKLLDGALNSDDDAAPLIMALDGLRERGVCLLMEAHAGHAKQLGGERDLRPRGSSALLGWPEFGLGLRPMEEDDTMVSLVHWRGDREARDWPKRLRRGVAGEMPWMPANP